MCKVYGRCEGVAAANASGSDVESIQEDVTKERNAEREQMEEAGKERLDSAHDERKERSLSGAQREPGSSRRISTNIS